MGQTAPMVHDAAETGFGAGVDAYRRARPGYAPELLARLNEVLNGLVVELGAGTGILTQELVAAGHRVLAVEPVDEMRAALLQSVDGVEARNGTAEAIPVGDGEAGAVVAAQAFHWFDHGPALDEIGRVLEPGGVLAVLWNVRDETVPWVAEFGRVMDQHRGSTPSHDSGQWRKPIDDDERFLLDFELDVEHGSPTDGDGVVDRALSVSFIASLDAAAQAQVTEEVGRLVASMDTPFDFPYRSQLHVWRRM